MTALPIEPLIPEILATLEGRGRLVLQAPPGAGKTTRLPLALLEAPFLKGKKIIVLEPRRLAARLAARFMAGQLGEEVGERVGYRVRLENKVGPKTRVELVTDGLYLRRLQEDPGLEGVGCVLFDEFHERGLESDLALALTLEAASLNPDLKLIVMSATLDAQPVAKLLGDAPILTSQGRAFPVETLYLPRAPEDRIEEVTARAVKRALAERVGSLLVFLPGQAEIRRVAERLSDLPADVILAPLYGDLDLKVQDAAVKPAPAGQRKVVLATSIAETSLTIEGIGVVIDSGLARQPRYDPKSGMTRLETLRASQATAEQRRGRAGRLGPGTCYRLWTEADQRARPSKPKAEIAIADLAGFALELASWGAGADLALLEPPPTGTLAEAKALLADLGALDGEGRITSHGKAMASLGLHPRLAHMILAAKPEERRLACDLAALLGERDPIKGPPAERPADMQLRLDLLRGERGDVAGGVDRGVIARARQLAKQWAGQVRAPASDPSATPGGLLALAYPDRLAQRREERGRFRLSNGKGASLKPHDTLAGEEFLAVAELDGQAGEARIFLAAALSRQELEARFASRLEAQVILAWSARDEAVEAKRQRRLGALILEERALKDPDPEKLQAALEDGIRQMGLAVLPWSESSLALRQRLSFLHRHRPQDWPAVGDEALLANLPQWLGPFLSGKSRRSHLASIDLHQALLGLLDHRQRRELDRLAPARLSVPTGRDVPIDYSGEHPVLAVKLQEMFGQISSPRVLDGQVAVILHLLSPAGRPLQVTSDLEGFWKGTYVQVRADMRGRYPRHPWPDNPLEAAPQRGLKRR